MSTDNPLALNRMVENAVKTLYAMLASKDEAVRLEAARIILHHSIELRRLKELNVSIPVEIEP